jgi:hypothetical protein
MGRRATRLALAVLAAAGAGGCGRAEKTPLEVVGNSKVAAAASASDPDAIAKPTGPKLGVVQMAAMVRERPDPRSPEIGYLRLGAVVTRALKPAAFDACQGGYYQILPRGYVCADAAVTIDLNHPLLRANLRPPDRHKPLPYTYAFVRAIAPRYYRLPTKKEQSQYEMSLDRHLRSFHRLKQKWNDAPVGANDIPIDAIGRVLGPPPPAPPDLTDNEKFGGLGDNTQPWFFKGGRKIPNIADFKVPDYAVMTNRIKRHAGVALIDAFTGEDRHFALTTDLRLIPTSKLKPGRGSTFHGVEIGNGWELPVAFVKTPDAFPFEKDQGRFRRLKQRYAYGDPIQLTGDVRRDGTVRFLETAAGHWLKTADLAVVAKTTDLPRFATGSTKWVDVSIQRQTLTLFEGKRPIYATMVSTGKDGLGDPRTTHSTPTGTFAIRDKHITAAMDSQVLGSEFELGDVPWVQYFKAGYALHAAYWHTEYGRPRSHGCINLSPIDAYRLFNWTEPAVPDGWHGVDAGETFGEGTRVFVHP